ncbi:hypothetical protein [Congregibacter litoralis]|uniref:Tetratricopeptide repeat protein n=1 Tax=Congregibacter litoralis KT71 TaxID=314285 RepID=A4A5H5_9GAMM|nr:hypothetical protein [Congregibacter litoralis]EAQ99046.1 hypothetical protein KT71_10472 [Congregibacter litoralis KT71]
MLTNGRNTSIFLLLSVFILAAVSASYLPALSGPWLFDDTPNLLENRALKEFHWTRFDDLRDVAVSGRAGPLGRPISLLSFLGQRYQDQILSSYAVKAVNLGIHFLIAIILGYLALKIFAAWGFSERQAKVAALLTAALWCAAPLHVSTVMYAVQRMSQLSALWVLLGLAVYVRCRERWVEQMPGLEHVLAMLLWLMLCLVLGLYSKENAVMLLPLLVLLEVSVFGCVVAGSQRRGLQRVGVGAACLCLMAPWILYFLEPAWLTESYARRNFSLEDRVAVQVPLLWKYLQWTLLPDLRSLVFLQDGQWTLLENSWGPLIAAAAWLLAMTLAIALRSRELIFALSFFLLAHSIESTVLALEVSYEHRNYLPSAGLLLGFVAVAFSLGKRFERERLTLAIMVLLLGLSLVTLTLRSQIWSSSESIYEHAYRYSPESPRSKFLYAAALLDTSSVDDSGTDAVLLKQARLVEARERLKELAQADVPDIAALALLMRIDSSIFPQLAGREPWAKLMIRALAMTQLQAEDYAALSFLTDCLLDGSCTMSADERASLLDSFHKDTGKPAFMAGLRARLTGGGPEYVQGIYEKLAEGEAPAPIVYARLIEIYSEAGERGKSIDAMRQLLSIDERRTFLKPMIRAIE